MLNRSNFTCLSVAVLLILFTSGIVCAAEHEDAEPADDGSMPIYEEELPAPLQQPPAKEEVFSGLASAAAGYRFISVNRSGGRAAEYEYLHSSPFFSGSTDYMRLEDKFSLGVGFLNEKDFHGDLNYDHKGILRFKLATDSLFHNLDHLQLFTPSFSFGSNPYTSVDNNIRDRYGIRVEQDLAQLRYRLATFPAHLNLGYWRIAKKGSSQLIYADQAFQETSGTTNTIYSKTRGIDRQTHEGQFGFDAHLGLIDLVYEFRIRQFGEDAPTSRDAFVAGTSGTFQHNENPDSRFYSNTIRIHTSLSGGIVGAASYTNARRENRSNLADFRGADQTNNTINNVAGDLSYTPSPLFSLALKYRRQDVERNGPATLTSSTNIPSPSVRQPLDTQKDSISATLSYRPTNLFTVKGEYRGEFLARDSIDLWVQPPGGTATLSFPAHSDTHTGSIAFISRPIKGLRANAEYKYSTSDSPMYPTAYEEKHEGTAQLSYNAPNRWGVTANTRISRQSSDHLTLNSLDSVNNPVTFQMPRNRQVANTVMSLWVVPLRKLTVTGSYALLRTSTDEAVLLVNSVPTSRTLTNFTSQAQVYGVNAAYYWDERLDLSLALQQVRSYAEFDPQPDPTGIKDISRLNTVESSLAARADYRFTENLSCALEYSFRDYDDITSVLFNGSVNSVMLYVASKW